MPKYDMSPEELAALQAYAEGLPPAVRDEWDRRGWRNMLQNPAAKAMMLAPAMVYGAGKSVADAFTAPGRAYRGEIPRGEMLGEALNMAGALSSGTLAGPRGKNIARTGLSSADEALIAEMEALTKEIGGGKGKVPAQEIGKIHALGPSDFPIEEIYHANGIIVDPNFPTAAEVAAVFKTLNNGSISHATDALVEEIAAYGKMWHKATSSVEKKELSDYIATLTSAMDTLSQPDLPKLVFKDVGGKTINVASEYAKFQKQLNGNGGQKEATPSVAAALSAKMEQESKFTPPVLADLTKESVQANGFTPSGRYVGTMDREELLPAAYTKLPLDFESRMARAQEMGFDVGQPLYRAIQGHDAYSLDKATGFGFGDPANKRAERAIFLTNNPEISNRYVHEAMPGPQSYPVYARAENPITLNWRDYVKTGHYSNSAMEDIIDAAWNAGHDFITLKDINDLGGTQTQYLVRNPNQLRSPYAVFDPAYSHSNNLLRAGGVPLPREDENKRKKK